MKSDFIFTITQHIIILYFNFNSHSIFLTIFIYLLLIQPICFLLILE